ncbi:MAG: 2-hydroxyacid dehydrogenase [Burkholderiales bacterium]
MNKPKVLVTREVFAETLEYLNQHCLVTMNETGVRYAPQDLTANLRGMQGAVLTVTEKVDAQILEACPGIKVLANAAVGYNNIDVPACTQRGIMVTNTPGVLTNSVADYAMGLLIATCRRITEGEHHLRSGQWNDTFPKQMLGMDVHGATLGIFGFGRIGEAIAKRARGFDMKVIYHNRRRASPESERAVNATYVSKEDLLRQADVVMLIMPYNPETHHFIGTAQLALMKPTGVLINMARGGIVDDAALIRALSARQIWAAGLDVYENEPKFLPEFLPLKNVVLSPHIASASEPTRQAMAMTAAKNCVAALCGETPPNLVNPEVKAK